MNYLLGASGHGLVINDILKLNNIEIDKFIDINSNITFWDGIEVIHPNSLSINSDDKFIISIGNNKLRKINVKLIPTKQFFNAIHPKSYISKNAKIGVGVVVFANCVVNPNVTIGDHVILNSSSCIEHDSIIENYSHVSPGAIICGNVKIGEGTHIGAGATVIPNINIGKWCVIGAGAVIINDVPDYSLVVGVPGKVIKKL
jgi:sugar O-acyltransferase (sialic acid O-acetyltransferase NeuD family)